MDNFHCITSGCAEVRYQRYIAGGGVRYRYPGEEWITVDGDDYSVEALSDFGDKYFNVFAEGKFQYYGIPGAFYFSTFYPYQYENGGNIIGRGTEQDNFRALASFRGKIRSQLIEPPVNQSSCLLSLRN